LSLRAWCLPGGKVDRGETGDEAIRKEMKEETGLDVCSSRLLFLQDSLPTEPGGTHYLNLYFECEWAGVVILNHESSHFAWISTDEISHYEIVFGQ
jgi:ADP-ribose pyrophosphatase YjhB (NUDIX family)